MGRSDWPARRGAPAIPPSSALVSTPTPAPCTSRSTGRGRRARPAGPGGSTGPARPQPPAAGPLLVMLHGAGGQTRYVVDPVLETVERDGIAMLVPESRSDTWDVIMGGYGPDVAYLDAALERVFATIPVDPAHIGIGGFSDG